MATRKISLMRGKRLRMTRLDGCGRPVFGEASTAVTKGFITVSFTANTSETDEILVTNAGGDRCVYEPAETSITGYGVEIEFCEVDPDLFSMVTGQDVVLDSFGNSSGFDIDTSVDLSGLGFALELWMGAGSADAASCSTEGGDGNFGYLLLPYLRGGIVGDFSVENGNITFTITGANTRDGNAWGVGPYSDIQMSGSAPSAMLTPVKSTTALRLILTDVAPPEPMAGTRPLLDPSLAALTAVSATGDGGSLEADFTVTPASTGPVWYEFGDGEWDYVLAPGVGSHVYSEPGTYTVRATQNGSFVETTVTVPFA